ncbi:MAG TPA: hypothetical protein ENN44_00215 [Methanoculleus sp.]|nr:hypothetical protein [Methanoculleus sp.]
MTRYDKTFMILICLLVMVGSADAITQIRAPNEILNVGSDAVMAIEIIGIEGADLIAFNLEYDPSIISVKKSKVTDRFPGTSLISNNQQSTILFAIFTSGKSITADEWEPIVEITIQPVSSSGTTDLTIKEAHYVKGFEQYDFDSVLHGSIQISSDSSETSFPQEISSGTIEHKTEMPPSEIQTADIPEITADIPEIPVSDEQKPLSEQSNPNILGSFLVLGLVGAIVIILRKVE